MTTKLLPAFAALALLGGLAACSAPTTTHDAGGAADAGASAAATAAASAAVDASSGPSSVDVCSLVPIAELTAAVGADPGAGANSSQNGLDQCTWSQDGTPAALAQYTDQPDVYLPDSVWPKPDTGVDITGVTRGYADADSRTVLVVKDGKGILVNDFFFGVAPGDQDAWSALGAALAANL